MCPREKVPTLVCTEVGQLGHRCRIAQETGGGKKKDLGVRGNVIQGKKGASNEPRGKGRGRQVQQKIGNASEGELWRPRRGK